MATEYTLTLLNSVTDDETTIIETTSIEQFVLAVSRIPVDDIWTHWVHESDVSELDDYDSGETLVSVCLDEWLFDFIGREF
jgi:hypothetical protein